MSNDASSIQAAESPAVYASALPGPLGTLDTWISRFEAAVLAIAVLAMATNTVANVVGRFVFQHSLFFTEEVNRILIVLITFAGVGYAARHGRHIRMSALTGACPKPVRKTVMVLICLVTAIVMGGLAYFSVRYVLSLVDSGRVLPSLQIPVYWIYLWVPIGLGITAIQYLLTAWQNLTHSDVYLSTEVKEARQSVAKDGAL
jgi:C4-dicarboxylate transporter DctQ subunit